MSEILMPKATAVWLIDNTSLTFDQIADFCGLHPLAVKGIADGDVAAGVLGADPIANDQLTRDEIAAAEADPEKRMVANASKHAELVNRKRKGPRYTPLSRRQERPNAIAWLLKNHPEVPDSQIVKLIGTTKTTIQAVRDRSHWNAANIQAQDPVALGLCGQMELDDVVRVAAAKLAKKRAQETVEDEDPGASLAPIPPAVDYPDAGAELQEDDAPAKKEEAVDADSVFAGLGGASTQSEAE